MKFSIFFTESQFAALIGRLADALNQADKKSVFQPVDAGSAPAVEFINQARFDGRMLIVRDVVGNDEYRILTNPADHLQNLLKITAHYFPSDLCCEKKELAKCNMSVAA